MRSRPDKTRSRSQMRSFLLPLLVAIVAMVLWAGLVVMGTLNGWGRKPLAPAGNANAFMEAARKEIAAKHRGNAAFRLIENGKLHDEYFVSATPLIAKRCFKSLL